jgi:amidophosphoribosyltransferase
MADASADDSLLADEADDHFHDECGVFGIFGRQDAAPIVALGLHALQHRGQEAAGIVSYDGTQFHVERHVGLIGDTFTKPAVMERLLGNRAIGHTRYATTGGAGLRNVQPFFAELADGGLAIAHNGNLTNALTVQRLLQKEGAIFSSTSDTETILHLIATSRERDLNSRFIDAMRQVEGAFSLVALSSKKMIGMRDPLGIRPLVLGDLDGAWILASETCALDIIGARFVRDLKPGEMVVVTAKGIESSFPFEPQKSRFCIFEYVYFARPDSMMDDISVHKARMRMGVKLGEKILRERPDHDIDVVIPIPDTSRDAALEIANVLGVKYREGFIKNRYVGRTFIMPGQGERAASVKRKLNPIPLEFKDRVVLLVDDSIVRGTTSKQIVQMARDAGARKVYLASAAPPVRYPNIYGIDMPSVDELVAHDRSEEQIQQILGCDWLIYQDLKDLEEAVSGPKQRIDRFDSSCFDGNYVTGIEPGYFERIQQLRSDEAKKTRRAS